MARIAISDCLSLYDRRIVYSSVFHCLIDGVNRFGVIIGLTKYNLADYEKHSNEL